MMHIIYVAALTWCLLVNGIDGVQVKQSFREIGNIFPLGGNENGFLAAYEDYMSVKQDYEYISHLQSPIFENTGTPDICASCGDHASSYRKFQDKPPFNQSITSDWMPKSYKAIVTSPSGEHKKSEDTGRIELLKKKKFLCKSDANISVEDMEILEELGPIDIVYTWVNGSDAELAMQRNEWFFKLFNVNKTFDPQRVSDHGELRHSLRSLWKNVEWFHHIYIITNDQVPDWLNVNHPCLSLVPTDSVFLDKRNEAPSFSSVAIEWNMYNIPNLTDHFVYLNDDFYFNAPTPLSAWYSIREGYLFYQQWSINTPLDRVYKPEATQGGLEYCSSICPDSKLGDFICDDGCNIPECAGDMGDCAAIYPSTIDIHPEVSGEEYYLPLEAHAIFVDLSALFGTLPISRLSMTRRDLFRQVKLFDGEKGLLMLLYAEHDQRFKGLPEESRRGVVELVFENILFGIKQKVIINVRLQEAKDSDYLQERESEIIWEPNFNQHVFPNANKVTIVNGIHRYFYVPEAAAAKALKSQAEGFCFHKMPTHEVLASVYETITAWITGQITVKQYVGQIVSLMDGYASVLHHRDPQADCALFGASDHPSQTKMFENSEHYMPKLQWPRRIELFIGTRPKQQLVNFIPFKLEEPRSYMPVYKILNEFRGSLVQATRFLTVRNRRASPRTMFAEKEQAKSFDPLKVERHGNGRRTAPHMPLLFNRRIIATLRSTFVDPISMSSGSRFRRMDDMQFPFTYMHFLLEERVTVDFEKIFHSCDHDQNSVLTDFNEIECLLRTSNNPYADKLFHQLVDAFDECIWENTEKDFNEISKDAYSTAVGDISKSPQVPKVKRLLEVREHYEKLMLSSKSKKKKAENVNTKIAIPETLADTETDLNTLLLQGPLSLQLFQTCLKARPIVDAIFGERRRYRSKLIHPGSPRNNVHTFMPISNRGYTKAIRKLKALNSTFVCTNDHIRNNLKAGEAFNNFFESHFTSSLEFENKESARRR
eukprot:Nk52_evm12s1401 gene=Nk52_evmTU12s1401